MKEGIESHVVDAASIAVSRRRRRAKTDKIDGEGLLRALLAFKRGEPRVCSMVRVPTPQDEDRRRICRERKTLTAERIRHVNRIKGLLFSQGIGDYEPLRRDRRRALEAARTGDGRALGANMKAQIGRELDRLELLLGQIAAIEAERDAMLVRQAEAEAAPGAQSAQSAPARVQKLMELNGLGAETVAMLWTEAFYRSFDNRRQLAAFGGLAGTPWKSGSIDREQGVCLQSESDRNLSLPHDRPLSAPHGIFASLAMTARAKWLSSIHYFWASPQSRRGRPVATLWRGSHAPALPRACRHGRAGTEPCRANSKASRRRLH